MSDTIASLPKILVIEPALALLEFNSIAVGILSADAMVKHAVLDVVHAGTVHPGRFLVLAGGTVAEVEEALKVGKETAADTLNDIVFLAGVHREVVEALGGKRKSNFNDALGIIETSSVPAAIEAADKGIKGAEVSLIEIRLADGLHGKGLVLFSGHVSDVEAAIELSTNILRKEQLIHSVIIPQLHTEISSLLKRSTRFGTQMGWSAEYGNDE